MQPSETLQARQVGGLRNLQLEVGERAERLDVFGLRAAVAVADAAVGLAAVAKSKQQQH